MDLTPHLGAVIGDLADRLTLAGIGVSTLTIHTDYPGHELLLFRRLDPHRRPTIAEARQVLDALAATDVTVGAPYGSDDPQVNVSGVVDLGGQTVTVRLIASPDATPTSEEDAS